MLSLRSVTREKSLFQKAVLGAIITLCLVLGVIGLVLPIIPGLLFLALAAVLAGKLSRRIGAWVNKSTFLRGLSRQTTRLGGLTFVQRGKLVFWMCAKHSVEFLTALERKFSSGARAR